jgi:hypothetical protein
VPIAALKISQVKESMFVALGHVFSPPLCWTCASRAEVSNVAWVILRTLIVVPPWRPWCRTRSNNALWRVPRVSIVIHAKSSE